MKAVRYGIVETDSHLYCAFVDPGMYELVDTRPYEAPRIMMGRPGQKPGNWEAGWGPYPNMLGQCYATSSVDGGAESDASNQVLYSGPIEPEPASATETTPACGLGFEVTVGLVLILLFFRGKRWVS